MKTPLWFTALASMALLAAPVAMAQEQQDVPEAEPPPMDAPAAPPPAISAEVAAPPVTGDAPPAVNIPAPAAPGVMPTGQWVYTQQYGWTYMPTDRAYTYAPTADGGDPYMYAYYPAWGWRWMAAPWVFGIGPTPWFGRWGYANYGWYGHPWFGHPWWGYHHGYPGGYRGIVVSRPAWVHNTYVSNNHYTRTGTVMHGGARGGYAHPAPHAYRAPAPAQPHYAAPRRGGGFRHR